MENKTSKYLKYAIGEIVLVVIGILIALSINTWNDKRKDSKLAEKYIEAIYADLIKDTAAINIRNREFEAYIKVIDSYSVRIKQSKSPIDTILKIARFEYVGYFNPVNNFNNNAYITLINTGDVSILDSWLQKDLTELNSNQVNNKQIIDANISIYREFWAKVPPAKTNTFVTENIKDLFWNDRSKIMMAEKITQEMSYRVIIFKNIIHMRKEILDMTIKLMERLEKNYPFLKLSND